MTASTRTARQREDLLLFQRLAELVQAVTSLSSQVAAQINAITHSNAPDTVIIGKECDTYLNHFKNQIELRLNGFYKGFKQLKSDLNKWDTTKRQNATKYVQ